MNSYLVFGTVSVEGVPDDRIGRTFSSTYGTRSNFEDNVVKSTQNGLEGRSRKRKIFIGYDTNNHETTSHTDKHTGTEHSVFSY